MSVSEKEYENGAFYWARDVEGWFVVKYEDGRWWTVGVSSPMNSSFKPSVHLLYKIAPPVN